ncbi:MAG: DUF3021 family protein [Lachnospiraceae bacterium]|nr:DUF3021 family protein [Lachnospiraceae bacterium]
MNRCKLIFNQTLMISTAILFGLGIEELIEYISLSDEWINWQWYIPLSVIFTGFLCALASLVLVDEDSSLKKINMKVRIFIHFIALFVVVGGCGFVFNWYNGIRQLIPIAIIYVLTYVFVWATTIWIFKEDEKKINEAIKDIQDND